MFTITSSLTLFDWGLAVCCIFALGLGKSGLKGMGILIVTAMAFVFGSKSSTGILMPMLVIGDIFAIIYYRRHVAWYYLLKLLPWMLLGIFIGVYIGNVISERIFTIFMSILILSSTAMMFWVEINKNNKIFQHKSFPVVMGAFSGISTMIGNLSGAFSNLYFIAMRLPKNIFIGTAAWLYFIINVFKVPFHIFVWKTIDLESLKISLTLLPVELIGLFVGVRIVSKIKNKHYVKYILIVSAIGAILLFFK